ncbi:MAG: trypsin-like peptidase domain-containing protein [Kangiellaceae bacterium]|jgi:serine protease DegS|nr:trypsin-like peptidase domain-containing protein [Kangiellaceae bacterium]
MKFWIKYIVLGLAIALAYLLLWSDSAASIMLRQSIAQRFVDVLPARPTKDTTELSPASFADAIKRTAPAVVSIQTIGQSTVQRNPRATNRNDQYYVDVGINVGSGVIIDPRGYVVTNYHVVHGAKSIKVQLSDGREKIATIVGVDSLTDIALLHIDLEQLPLPIINYEREINTGDIVFAIGNPYGRFDQTVTMGIVSATRKVANKNIPELLQTDVAVHVGNSGGALINAHGELIGINNMQLAARQLGGAQTGISFTIPYYEINNIIQELLENQGRPAPYFGFSVDLLSQQEHQNKAPTNLPYGVGVSISEVSKDGPADQAGLQLNDFVTHFNGEIINSIRQIASEIRRLNPGDSITLQVYRDNRAVLITIKSINNPEASVLTQT